MKNAKHFGKNYLKIKWGTNKYKNWWCLKMGETNLKNTLTAAIQHESFQNDEVNLGTICEQLKATGEMPVDLFNQIENAFLS